MQFINNLVTSYTLKSVLTLTNSNSNELINLIKKHLYSNFKMLVLHVVTLELGLNSTRVFSSNNKVYIFIFW